MRIIGIDPGSVITGIGVVEITNGSIKVLDYDALKMSSKESIPSRLKKIYDICSHKINKYKPDALSVETAFFGKNIQSTMKLGQVRGAVIISALNAGIKVSEYSPREIKKSVTGNGASSKMQVQDYVKKILAMKEDRILNDSSDALAIALCHYYNSTNVIPVSLKPSKGKSGWKDFVDKHPEKLLRR